MRKIKSSQILNMQNSKLSNFTVKILKTEPITALFDIEET